MNPDELFRKAVRALLNGDLDASDEASAQLGEMCSIAARANEDGTWSPAAHQRTAQWAMALLIVQTEWCSVTSRKVAP